MTNADLESSRIFVAGHTGLVGSAVLRYLSSRCSEDVITCRSCELDLCSQADVHAFLSDQRPDIVIFAAARVGGIHANDTFPAEFIYENLAMAINIIHAAYRTGVGRLLFLGSTCIYPREADQPIREEALLTGPLESTNEAYAMAKIAGLKMCQFYRRQYDVLFHSAMPTNLYGPGDNYHPENSHVLPSLIRRFHEAKQVRQPQVTIWGTGLARREFLHVDDLAAAIIHLIGLADPPDWVNIGTGKEISIQQLAQLVAEVVGYQGRITNDLTKPTGTMRKRTNTTRIRSTGWRAKIGLRAGIQQTYESFLSERESDVLRTR